MGLGENTQEVHGLALTSEAVRIALRQMLVPDSRRLLGFTHRFKDENGNFFPRRSCFTTRPNLRMHIERAKSHLWNFWMRDVARICKREAPQAFGHHPGQSPTIPHIADSTSRRSSLRVECLQTGRMIIMNTQCRHSIRAALTSGKGSMI